MTGADAPSVVLVPGLGNTAALWTAQWEALSEKWNVIIPDYRGCESVAAMADCVVASMPQEAVALAGFSLGGYIAFNILRRYPTRVSRLALISSSPYADSEANKKLRQQLITKSKHDYEGLLVEMAQIVISDGGPLTDDARQCLFDMGLELGADEFRRQQQAAMERADSCDQLADICLPTRVLCGSEDRVTPVAGNRYIAEHVADATLDIVDGAGHILPLERPERVTAFLRDWLTEPDIAR